MKKLMMALFLLIAAPLAKADESVTCRAGYAWGNGPIIQGMYREAAAANKQVIALAIAGGTETPNGQNWDPVVCTVAKLRDDPAPNGNIHTICENAAFPNPGGYQVTLEVLMRKNLNSGFPKTLSISITSGSTTGNGQYWDPSVCVTSSD